MVANGPRQWGRADEPRGVHLPIPVHQMGSTIDQDTRLVRVRASLRSSRTHGRGEARHTEERDVIYAAAVSVLVGIAIGVIERSPTSCSSRLMSQTGGT